MSGPAEIESSDESGHDEDEGEGLTRRDGRPRRARRVEGGEGEALLFPRVERTLADMVNELAPCCFEVAAGPPLRFVFEPDVIVADLVRAISARSANLKRRERIYLRWLQQRLLVEDMFQP